MKNKFNPMRPGSALNACAGALMKGAAMGLLMVSAAHASFVNGDFEALPDFDGWNTLGYQIPGNIPTFPPTTEAHLGLTATPANNRSAVLDAGSESLTGSTLTWSDRVARVHTPVNSSGRSLTASAIEQTIEISASDVDADGKVHVRFTAAPVLEDPGHPDDQQPYFFIEINKVSDGTSLYSTFNFANQAGVPWVTVGGIKYTDWQAFDIALDPALVGVGDEVKIKVIAAGCGQTGHAGAVYLNNVRTAGSITGSSLWVTAEGPEAVWRHTNPDGTTDITYTYTYTNNGSTPVEDVVVNPAMPETTAAETTTFVGITNPTFGGGTCTAPAAGVGSTDPAACSIGTLQPGESGTFTMTVRVPATTTADQVNNGTYPISGTGVPALLGPLVETDLLADMVPDLSNLPSGGGTPGQSYPEDASFSCTNQGATAAIGATCGVTNLPPGVTVGQCTIAPPEPGVSWTEPANVPVGATVTCPVTGTPTGPAPGPIEGTTDADNDGDPDNNTTDQPIPAPAQATPVPTLSEWMMIVLAALLAVAGVAGMRRNRNA